MRTITRESLYEQVWKKPLKDLAAEYGLSDVGLAKICERLEVPRPPQGHWARILHGHEFTCPPLPPPGSGVPTHFQASEPRAKVAKTTRPPAPEIDVAVKLTNPHPIVRVLKERLVPDFRTSGIRVVRYPEQATLRASAAHEDRALRIVDALCRWLSDVGHRVGLAESPTDSRWVKLVVGVGENAFRISLLESAKQVKHVLTPDEAKRLAKYGSSWGRKVDLIGTGVFTLRFLHLDSSEVYGTWSDHLKPLEDQLGEAALRVTEIFEELKIAKQRRAEARQSYEAEERAESRERDLEEHDALLRTDLLEMTKRWDEASRMRAFIDAVEPSLLAIPDGDRDGRRAWLVWARAYVDSIDPVRAPGTVAKSLWPVYDEE